MTRIPRLRCLVAGLVLSTAMAACGGPPVPPPTPTPAPTRVVHATIEPVVTGEPIRLDELKGRIVFDDFEDVYLMDVDGSDVVTVAGDPAGPEFDGDLSPDGAWVVYRDSTRGVNENDEIFIARSDGSDRRSLTNDPANDWGPAWSPDGAAIVFNSDRNLGPMGGYLMDPDGSNVRRIEVEGWVEYPSFSPDGTQLAFMSALGSNYEIFVADLDTGALTQLTDSRGSDAWPAWSPDGSTIAFTSTRDDCVFAPDDQECWQGDEPGDYRTVWLIDPDGSNERRVNGETGQFVTWSPDGAYLLVSGRALYVVRPDGTGRLELRAEGFDLPLGGIPDWGPGAGLD